MIGGLLEACGRRIVDSRFITIELWLVLLQRGGLSESVYAEVVGHRGSVVPAPDAAFSDSWVVESAWWSARVPGGRNAPRSAGGLRIDLPMLQAADWRRPNKRLGV
ncbi:hypothetical protein LAD77_30035 [Klebsiella pneumoniae]|nr:hypothetical protein [Klebsiella pneumoniae]